MTIKTGWLTAKEIMETVWRDADRTTVFRWLRKAPPEFRRVRLRSNKGPGHLAQEYHYSCLPAARREELELLLMPDIPRNRYTIAFPAASMIAFDLSRPIGERLIVRVPALSRPTV